jgi:class 3 adenylate cyclase
MGLKEDLEKEISVIFKSKWEKRDGKTIPEPKDIKLSGNEGVRIKGTVLYADLDGSTNMVDSYEPEFAAEIYKAYLYGTAKIINNEVGVITAYDGDRIMAVYIGNSKNTDAARTALKINYLVHQIINPLIKSLYSKSNFQVKQVVGIDTSDLLAAHTGVRGNNDLVWVGRAANYAAKLTSLSEASSWITEEVFDSLDKSSKYSSENQIMWARRTWASMSGIIIYQSNWWWEV